MIYSNDIIITPHCKKNAKIPLYRKFSFLPLIQESILFSELDSFVLCWKLKRLL